MPQSLVKILVHIVFSTKDRINLITTDIEDDLYSYIHGIVEKNGARLITANGTMNHSHFLVSLGRNDVSELIGDMKRDSSDKETWDPKVLLAAWLRCIFDRPITGANSYKVYTQSKSAS
jgi:hypothetical protein